MIGIPVHLKTKNQNWTACGKQSDSAAWDYRHVTCLLCRKTRNWKARQSEKATPKLWSK